MKKKNYIILSLAAMMALLFAACGSTEKKEEVTPVVKAFGAGTNCIEGDCLNGKGKAKFKDVEYTGDFSTNKVSGNGVMAWPNGAKYEGTYAENKRDGKGTYTFSNGDTYTGDFKDNIKNGTGEYKWKDGDSYSGEWKDGKQHGTGTYKWATGVVYTGEWKDGMLDGKGTLSWPDTSKVAGIFEKNKLISEQ